MHRGQAHFRGSRRIRTYRGKCAGPKALTPREVRSSTIARRLHPAGDGAVDLARCASGIPSRGEPGSYPPCSAGQRIRKRSKMIASSSLQLRPRAESVRRRYLRCSRRQPSRDLSSSPSSLANSAFASLMRSRQERTAAGQVRVHPDPRAGPCFRGQHACDGLGFAAGTRHMYGLSGIRRRWPPTALTSATAATWGKPRTSRTWGKQRTSRIPRIWQKQRTSRRLRTGRGRRPRQWHRPIRRRAARRRDPAGPRCPARPRSRWPGCLAGRRRRPRRGRQRQVLR